MKKNKLLVGVGIGSIALAACAVVKNIFDQHKDDDLNDQEVPRISADPDENEDRGVAPVETTSEENDEVKNLKADAINHGYKPIEY